MASVDFLETMISHNSKELYLKFEILEYDKNTKDFELIDETIVKERKLPDGVSNLSGGIDINVEQDVMSTLDLSIVNEAGINNWGSNFDPDDPEDPFKWWLDKRMNIFMGLRLDNSDEIEFIQMGHFVITHFKTNHTLTEYPTTEIGRAHV